MLRHVILDLDGTLVDSHAQITAIIDAMRAERGGAPVDPTGSRRHMSLGGGHLIATLLGECGREAAADLAEFRRRYAAEPTRADALYPGVREGLATLRDAGLTLSLCSNKPQALCEAVLRDVAVADLFAVIVGGQPTLPAKPAPDMLLTVVDRLGASPGECVFVGDSEVDHATAAAAGVPFRFVSYGYAAPAWRCDDPRFDCFGDLTGALARADA